jgi:hypothetical protein
MSGNPISSESNLHRKSFLLLGFLGFVFPLLNACMNAAEREQLLFVVNHFLPARAGERIILLQEDRFLGQTSWQNPQKMQRSMSISIPLASSPRSPICKPPVRAA